MSPAPADELDEQKMTEWLTKLMRDQPNDPITKQDAHALAEEVGLRPISGRGFDDRAWPDAVKASGVEKKKWSGGGRRGSAALIAARDRLNRRI